MTSTSHPSCGQKQIIILDIPDWHYQRNMDRYEASLAHMDEDRPSPPSSSPSPPQSKMKPISVPQSSSQLPATILQQSANPTTMKSNHPLMQFQESITQTNPSLIPMSITKVPSNTSLERVITTSKMAALQARRGSGSSLTNLRSSLLAADNPRRGSAIGQCMSDHAEYKVAL